MKTLKQLSKIVAGGSLAAAAAISPQVQAHGHGDTDARIQMLEQQIMQLKKQLADIQSHELVHHDKILELDQWKQQVGEVGGTGNSMIYFRGGWAHLDKSRERELLPDAGGILGKASGHDGFYVGAGIEHLLSKDVFGLTEGTFLDGTDVLGEIMFEYKRFAQAQNATQPLEFLTGAHGVSNNGVAQSVTVTQFTLTAAPKIKFMRGSKFRPWIIPVGLGIHVISPPSDGVTVLNPGLMFGAGADYNLWKNLYIGADVRYHLTANYKDLGGIDGSDSNNLTVGGYLGFGF